MIDFPILSLVTFLPLAGALCILFTKGDEAAVARNARATALLTSGLTFLLSLYMYFHFDPASAAYQFVETRDWLPGPGVSYRMGVDGISIFFILLSTFLTPLCLLSAAGSVKARVKEYMLCFLLLETMMVGMFCALDLVLFYVFFEGVLIPMFILIGVWGGARRVYAAFKFFLYTLLGSVLLLVGILTLLRQTGTTDIEALSAIALPTTLQTWLWLAFFASFAVKVPMWPVHTWLPDAHVEAPTAGSVILAGVLLKMGGYGFLRLSIPLLPEASHAFAPFVMVLSCAAVVYTSLVALVQDDIKKLIAYSSVAHMGLVTLGLFAFNPQGMGGAVFQMLSHGVVSAALFLCVGVLYDRLHTREIRRYGGIVGNMPVFAALFMLFTMASVALPGTAGFVGEFLVLLGAYKASTWATAVAALGAILGAAYMLRLYRRVAFGPAVNDDARAMPDLSAREIAIFAPLAVLTVWMGVYPATFTAPVEPSVKRVVDAYHARIAATAEQRTAP